MTIDFTQVVIALVGAVMTCVSSAFLYWLQNHIKDQAAAATIGKAVQNSLGAVQQAVDAGLAYHPLQAKLPAGTSAATAAGVQYVLDQAGPEIAHLGTMTTDAIVAKVQAQQGLAKVTQAPLADNVPADPGPGPVPNIPNLATTLGKSGGQAV